MHLTPLSVDVPSLDLPAVFDVDTIYRQFQTLADARKRRGVRYPLAVLLTIAVMAKLAGYRGARAIADWATLRAEVLAELFDLPRPRMPHLTTWTRVFGHAVVLEAFEHVVAQISAPASSAEVPARGSRQVCLDGKTLRGTIPLGRTSGVHLLAAYHADQGVVLAQCAVDAKANEIVVAPQVLDQLDLTGVVVSGDAMFAQRRLSTQIVEAGGITSGGSRTTSRPCWPIWSCCSPRNMRVRAGRCRRSISRPPPRLRKGMGGWSSAC